MEFDFRIDTGARPAAPVGAKPVEEMRPFLDGSWKKD